jgi:ferrochelatase
MKHWSPSIHDALKALNEKGAKRVVCLIMTPFSTEATVAGYRVAIEHRITDTMEVYYVPSWHTNPFYLDAAIDKVKEGLALFPHHRQPHVHMVFTAHSLPLAAVENDPYVDQIKTTIGKVMQQFSDHDWSLAFQSQGKKGGPWLSPNVEGVLENMARMGKKEALVIPLGFVADHLETLYDLDIALKAKAHGLGFVLRRSPSLNDSPKFIEALADISLTSVDALSS